LNLSQVFLQRSWTNPMLGAEAPSPPYLPHFQCTKTQLPVKPNSCRHVC
ncbi:unnamed protein product, partial [Ectocarpus fasciculatus]